MRTIPLSHSITTFWQELVFLEAALLASEETQPLAAPVTALADSFTTTQELELSSRRKVIQALARSSVADSKLDEGLRKVHNNTLHLVEQNRKQEAFATLFSGSISTVIRYALKRQVELAEEMVTALALPLYEQAFRDTQLGVLQPLIDKGKSVLEERRNAEFERVSARMDIKDWKQSVNGVRLAVYGELLGLAAATGRKKTWANMFFPSRATRAAADEIDEAGMEAAQGGETEAPAEA